MKRSRTIRNTMDSLSDLFHCNIEARNDSEDLQQDKEWSELYDLDAFFGRETRSRCSSEESNSVEEARSNSCSHYVESLNKCEDDCSVGLSIEEDVAPLAKSRKFSHDEDKLVSVLTTNPSSFQSGLESSFRADLLRLPSFLTAASSTSNCHVDRTDDLTQLTSHFLSLLCASVPNPNGQVVVL